MAPLVAAAHNDNTQAPASGGCQVGAALLLRPHLIWCHRQPPDCAHVCPEQSRETLLANVPNGPAAVFTGRHQVCIITKHLHKQDARYHVWVA